MLRRRFTTQLLKAAALGAAPVWRSNSEELRLRDAAARKKLLVGSAVSYAQLQRADFAALLAEQASIVVSENDMKWQATQPEPNRFNFTKADALLDFATQHGQKLRGHNLCWHEHNPAWLTQIATPQNAADLLRRHIVEVAGHFAGRIHSWDVVNEAITVEDGRPDGLRNSIWLQLLGPQYLDIAFRAAAEADSHALLTYNDYDLESDSPKHEAKRRAVLQLLSALRDRNVPIHALGIQSHLRGTVQPPKFAGFHTFLDQIEHLDLQAFVTELDVDDRELPADIAERDREVGKLYSDYLGNVLKHRAVKAVLTWGLTDRDTWLKSFHPRNNGAMQRPLPFDSELKPKPAFFAMRDAILACPAR